MAFLRLLLLCVLITSCYDDGPRPKSPAELISGENEFGRTWQVEKIEIEFGTVLPHECVTDNFITYFPDGTYEINEGATKCEPGDPPGLIGTWYITQGNDQLIVNVGGMTQAWDIDEIGDESHRLTSTFKEGYRTYTFVSSR
ncbi:hypothetical protein [Ekhidna sp.]|uniref:hypothetical protein n=1 Tax=Ekhidna sp. TaxID=2608089 RepID=UPI003B50AABC